MTSTPATADHELVQASAAECAERCRLHHSVWGDGFDLSLYLKREEALQEADFCRASHRMWLLRDGHGEPLASCETYTGHMMAMRPNGAVVRVPMETVASVVVDPRLRNLGHAGRLMQALGERLQFEGVMAATLYSDIGPQPYRKAGYLLHAARESVRTVTGAGWPTEARELGIGDVADVLREEAVSTEGWLMGAVAPAVGEVATPERIAWFHLRTQFRAWARGQAAPQVVGAVGPDGGFMLWTADAPESVVHSLVWRPQSELDARVLADAACAHAAELGLRQVIWWDADRDTGLDPYRRAGLQPPEALARDRDKGLPMLSWMGGGFFPLIWMGIERFGWA